MESIKEMAESILSDLMNNIPISELLLKAKIFASKKRRPRFIKFD